MRKLGYVCLFICSFFLIGCNNATPGKVLVETKWGKIEKIHRTQDGWFTTWSPGATSAELTIKSFTETTEPRVTSKDNAALVVPISVTASVLDNNESITAYVGKFGLEEKDQTARRTQILHGLIQTEAKNAFADFEAYGIYAAQEAIRKRIEEALRPQLLNQLHLNLESVQLGNPDFLDDRIEQAAGAVVANLKQKEAEEARRQAAEISAKTQEIASKVFQDPNLFKIKMLELTLDIERARADGIKGHQGSLTIINGASSPDLTLQLKGNK